MPVLAVMPAFPVAVLVVVDRTYTHIKYAKQHFVVTCHVEEYQWQLQSLLVTVILGQYPPINHSSCCTAYLPACLPVHIPSACLHPGLHLQLLASLAPVE